MLWVCVCNRTALFGSFSGFTMHGPLSYLPSFVSKSLRFHFCLVSVHSSLPSTSCLTLSIYTILWTYYFSLACLCSLSLAGFSALICSGTPHSSVAVAPCLHPRSRRFHGFTQSLRWERGKNRDREGRRESSSLEEEMNVHEKGDAIYCDKV